MRAYSVAYRYQLRDHLSAVSAKYADSFEISSLSLEEPYDFTAKIIKKLIIFVTSTISTIISRAIVEIAVRTMSRVLRYCIYA